MILPSDFAKNMRLLSILSSRHRICGQAHFVSLSSISSRSFSIGSSTDSLTLSKESSTIQQHVSDVSLSLPSTLVNTPIIHTTTSTTLTESVPESTKSLSESSISESVSSADEAQFQALLAHALENVKGIVEGSAADLQRLHDLKMRQHTLEADALSEARMKALVENESVLFHRMEGERFLAQSYEREWSEALTTRIEAEQAAVAERQPGRGRRIYGAFLLMLDAEVLARVTIRETLTFALSQGLGAKLARVLLGIGQAVEHEIVIATQASPSSPVFASSELRLQAVGNARAKKSRAAQYNAEKELYLESGWSGQLKAQVGGVLLQMLLESAYVSVDKKTGRLVEEKSLSTLQQPPAPSLAVNPLQALQSGSFGKLNQNTPLLTLDKEALEIQKKEKILQIKIDSSKEELSTSTETLLNKQVSKDRIEIDIGNTVVTKSSTPQTSAEQIPTPLITLRDGVNRSARGSGIFLAPATVAIPRQGTMSSRGAFGSMTGETTSRESNYPSRVDASVLEPLQKAPWSVLGLSGFANESDLLAIEAVKSRLTPDMKMVKSLDPKSLSDSTTLSFSNPDDLFDQLDGTSSSSSSIKNTNGSTSVSSSSSSQSTTLVVEKSRSSAASRRFDMDPAEKGREIKAAEARKVGQQTVVQQWSELQRMRAKTNGRLKALAEKAAANIKTHEITLPDGTQATVMPAFVMDYIWTHTSDTQLPVTGTVTSLGGGIAETASNAAVTAGRGIKYVSYIFANPRLAEILTAKAVLSAQQAPPPMVLVPNPWKDLKRGPYFRSSVPMVRTESEHRRVLSRVILEERLLLRRSKGQRPLDAEGNPMPLFHDVIDALNILGSAAWRINKPVLDSVRSLWRNDGDAPVPDLPVVPGMPPQRSIEAPYPALYWQHMLKAGLASPLVKKGVKGDKNISSVNKQSDDVLQTGSIEGAMLGWKQDVPKVDRENEHRRWAREVSRALTTDLSNMSLRASFNLALRRAIAHEDDKNLYFPHNMDFRGRVYPVPPHFNHMSSDFARGVLQFGEAVQLGQRGEFWLKVHLANLMGRDKLSFDDRVAYIDDNVNDVLAAGSDPFSDKGRFWVKADKPFQAQAVCRELSSVWMSPQHSRHLFESRVPVHQDGSCNGLQHYAALGRDEDGARAVNLLNTDEDKPADVYSRVLQLVLKKIAADAALECEATKPDGARLSRAREDTTVFAHAGAGAMWTVGSAQTTMKIGAIKAQGGAAAALKKKELQDAAALALKATFPSGRRIAQPKHEKVDLEFETRPLRKMCAVFLLGHVDRKMVKQTVMTSVYGVTFIGARDQVWNRLHERFGGAPVPGLTTDERDYMLQACAQYLARATLTSLGDLFSKAQRIMHWLGDIAQAVTSRNQPVSWITPLGMPVTQPYRVNRPSVVRAWRDGEGKIELHGSAAASDSSGVQGRDIDVHKSRQRSAFPPNFIHSLDSTHMFLTAISCNRHGIAFAAVHDSFWCHAAHADTMRDILRDQFVTLYKRPVLEDLRSNTEKRFPGLQLPKLPERGTLDLEEVKKAKYFFS